MCCPYKTGHNKSRKGVISCFYCKNIAESIVGKRIIGHFGVDARKASACAQIGNLCFGRVGKFSRACPTADGLDPPWG